MMSLGISDHDISVAGAAQRKLRIAQVISSIIERRDNEEREKQLEIDAANRSLDKRIDAEYLEAVKKSPSNRGSFGLTDPNGIWVAHGDVVAHAVGFHVKAVIGPPNWLETTDSLTIEYLSDAKSVDGVFARLVRICSALSAEIASANAVTS